MRRAIRSGFLLLLLAGICSVSAEAKKRAKIPLDPRFTTIENISVLPVVDARAGKKAGVNMEKLQGSVVNGLKKKHYSVSAAANSGQAGEIAIEDMENANTPYIKKLGPPSERWVMVVFLDDVVSKMTLGSTGNAELSGYLFDKESGELIWSGKGVGQAGQGGLIGMPMKGMMKGEALGAAVSNLLAGIPNLPKASN